MLHLTNLILVVALLASPMAIKEVVASNPIKNTVYDASIRKYSTLYNPEIPWKWLKAQLIAESGLDANAVSPVGAKGLGQFMPATWEQMQRELGFSASRSNPVLNIQASAYYMYKLRSQFRAPRPEVDKHSLAMASYNAGLGNVLKAQSLAGGSLLYCPMASKLHLVTGHHSKETITYVQRVWNYVGKLE